MKKVYLYVNTSKQKAIEIADFLKMRLIDQGYELVDGNQKSDVVIGVGGDGTLLQWLKDKNYHIDEPYVGINCGTLGFLQDFQITEYDQITQFVENLSDFVEQKYYFIEISLVTKSGEQYGFRALNEIEVLNREYRSFRTKVSVCEDFLEFYMGTGLIFSTPTGSTGHNIGAGGCAVYPGLELIQMTPSEATINSAMRSFGQSICIPKEMWICLKPVNEDEIKVVSDGKLVYEGNYKEIIISYSNCYMIKLVGKESSFTDRIREKLI